MGPQEPYWRTNTSFSPPPLDFRFQPEGVSFRSHDTGQLYGSSASSNSRANQYYSSPSEIEISPALQEFSVDDYSSSTRVLRPLSYSPTMEGTSLAATKDNSNGSISSRSDSSDYDSMTKSHSSVRRCFMSKPIHPFIDKLSEASASASDSLDLTDVSEPIESDNNSFKCGLCDRFLSQRSPWSSRRIVRSGDMPIAGVLSCSHVFHAECLDQTIPKARKNDPPCPICLNHNSIDNNDQCGLSKLLPTRVKPFREDGPSSRPWGCAQAGDCVPSRNKMLSLNRNRIRKSLSLKGNTGKEFPGKVRKSGTYTSPLFIG